MDFYEHHEKERFKVVNQICMKYSIGLIIYFAVELFTFSEYMDLENYMQTLICNVSCCKIMSCLTKDIKVKSWKKSKDFGIGKYFAFLFVNYGLIYIFFELGKKIHDPLVDKIFYFKKKRKFHGLNEENSENILNFFVICIIGPIAEELAYRKFIIERLIAYNQNLAIFFSGLIFGIIHKSILRFFECLFSGFVYAYSYVETSNIFIPISYHMLYNIIEYVINKNKSSYVEDLKYLKNFFRALGILGIIALLLNGIKFFKNTKKIFKNIFKIFKSYWMIFFIIEGFLYIGYYYIYIYY